MPPLWSSIVSFRGTMSQDGWMGLADNISEWLIPCRLALRSLRGLSLLHNGETFAHIVPKVVVMLLGRLESEYYGAWPCLKHGTDLLASHSGAQCLIDNGRRLFCALMTWLPQLPLLP